MVYINRKIYHLSLRNLGLTIGSNLNSEEVLTLSLIMFLIFWFSLANLYEIAFSSRFSSNLLTCAIFWSLSGLEVGLCLFLVGDGESFS
jgi:hypothetical protein